ncbi:oxygen-binding di-iron domain-containing protein [Geodermatophilus chilensis]|uniref:MBL fold metallo-hydrolase n=1 Tax=Geodermatophilus chilensis TaxID=2035835 RepID=UPI000C262297|nr:MBL fold metallo-hydrolase [Geodermatophilus chilensis]
MSFAPETPCTRIPPTRLDTDTWVVHQVQHALGAPLSVYLNSMVIAGEEPAIVDTGSVNNRSQWLEDVFGIVDPADVRWVLLSHDDSDHTGNLAPVMEACPTATLVCSWPLVERFSNAFRFPLDRCRWLNDGDTLDIGDRRLMAVRPPVYDSPATRGFLDERSGIYWGVDAFATPSPGDPAPTVADLDPGFWAQGMAMFVHHALSPWVGLVDRARYAAEVDRVRAMGMTTIATAHSPLIEGRSVADAFDLLRDLPDVPVPPVPDQDALDHILQTAVTAGM